MATCPNCGASSVLDPAALKVQQILVAQPISEVSLSGERMQVSATARLQLVCRCGWSIEGHVDAEQDNFIGDPKSQVFPAGSGPDTPPTVTI